MIACAYGSKDVVNVFITVAKQRDLKARLYNEILSYKVSINIKYMFDCDNTKV